MFLSALEKVDCKPNEALHIGDSLSSDIMGAGKLGVDAAWINRKGRALPEEFARPAYVVKDLRELADILQGEKSPLP